MNYFTDTPYPIAITCDIDLSLFISIEIWYEKPDLSSGILSGSYGGSGNLIASAALTALINDMPGAWHFQAVGITAGGDKFFSGKIKVDMKQGIQASA